MARGMKRWALAILATAGAARADTADQLAKSWPENDLERLLVAAAMDHTKSPAFVHALLTSEICALAEKPLPATPDAEDKIRLIGVQAPDGQPASPVFTSKHRGTDVFSGTHPVVCGKADALLNALRHSRVVVDPGQPFSFVYTADELDHILGVGFEIAKSDIQLQPPNDAPAAMIQKLKDLLAAEPRITSAWLSRAYWPDKKEWSWYLVIQTTLDAATVHTMIRDAANQIDMLGRPLDTAIDTPIKDPALGIMLLDR
jgi:SseB protein N-terminal domain/SseB protein C-terminal domain